MRKIVFKWHSRLALLALIPLLVISVTGSILVFKVEIDKWLMPSHMLVADSAASFPHRKSLDDLFALVKHAYPDYEIGSWEIFDDGQRSDTAYLIKHQSFPHQWYKLYVDQYAGQVVSTPVSVTHDITDWLLSLHYTFLLGVSGTFAGLIFAIVLSFLGISGIVLYRQFWRKLFTLRWQAAKRVLFSDIHKFIGIVSSPVIIIIALTGVYWNAVAVIHEVEEHSHGGEALNVPLHNTALSVQALHDKSLTAIDDFIPTYLVMPFEPGLQITFFGKVPTANPLISEYASTTSFEPQSGKLTLAYDIRSADGLAMFLDTFRKLHFGYFGGLLSKIIWCVLGLSPLWLALTGLYMYLIRKRFIEQT